MASKGIFFIIWSSIQAVLHFCLLKMKRDIWQGKMSVTHFNVKFLKRASYFQGCFPACCNSEHQTWNSFSEHNCRCYTLCINEGHRTGRDNMNNSLWQSQEGLSAGLSAQRRLSFHPVSPCWLWVLVWRGEEEWWERCVGCGWRRIMQWISSSFLCLYPPHLHLLFILILYCTEKSFASIQPLKLMGLQVKTCGISQPTYRGEKQKYSPMNYW